MTAKSLPAYRTISDSIRRDIVGRRLLPGDRLPNENDLADHFGVSRSTIREVLRDLTRQNLVETTRGSTGGTFVVVPRPEALARSLGVGISMLAGNDNLSVDQMLEAREVLEVPLTRLASERGTEAEIDAICRYADESLDAERPRSDLDATFSTWGFHSLIASAARNPLLELLCEPVLFVLEDWFAVSSSTDVYLSSVEEQHREIAKLLSERDGAGAADAMRRHLEFLRPHYRRVVARGRRDPDSSVD